MARKITIKKVSIKSVRTRKTPVALKRIDITTDLKKMIKRNRKLLVELSK